MKINVFSRLGPRTHEGAPARPITPLQQLRRSVLACLLWERTFYEDGEDIATRIVRTVLSLPEVDLDEVASLAVQARTEYKLRHAPLLLVSALARRGYKVRRLVPQVVRRADELAELVAIHCKVNGVAPSEAKKVLSAQLKRGLADAFHNFDAYELAKYNRKAPVRLRDVLFLTHPKPRNEAEARIWKQLADDELPPPDTWEAALSTGADKRETFERLIREDRLGYLALLRNLRNMEEAGVDRDLVRAAILARKGADKVLPFRFVAAARTAPVFARELNEAMLASLADLPRFEGQTLVLVDVSGSMTCPLSQRSALTRMDAAAALAVLVSGAKRVFTFSDQVVEVASWPGLAGIDAIVGSQLHRGTYLGRAVKHLNCIPHDRLIVITDEQAHDQVPDPVAARAYLINVAPYRNGVGYGRWVHIDGFSENVLRFLYEYEKVLATAAA